MASLLELPRYIQLALYADYLTVYDICSLDTANCNRLKRLIFLKLWKETQATVCGLPNNTLGTQYLRWLSLRGISIYHLNLRLNVENACHYQFSFANLIYLDLKEPKSLILFQSQLNRNYSQFLERLFGECHNLHTLCMSGPKLKGFQPLIANCQTTLTRIDVSGIQNLPAECICSILRCSKLASLTLNNSTFTKGAYLGNRLEVLCTGLLELNVESCLGFDDVLFNRIMCKTHELTSLNMTHSAVTANCGFSCLAKNCLQLTTLVYSTIIEQGIVDLFSHCTRLTSLSIHYDAKQPFLDTVLTNCSRYFSKLKTFKLLNAKTLQLTGLSDLSSVTNLSLAGCTKASGAFLIRLSSLCPLLTSLDVSGCSNMLSLYLNAVCVNCSLIELRVAHCDISAMSIAVCRGLTVLDLSGVSALDDSGLKRIVNNCPDLQVLQLKSCSGLTSASYVHIAQHCSALRELSMDGSGVTDVVLDEFHYNCPALRVLDIESKVVTVTSAAVSLLRHVRKVTLVT